MKNAPAFVGWKIHCLIISLPLILCRVGIKPEKQTVSASCTRNGAVGRGLGGQQAAGKGRIHAQKKEKCNSSVTPSFVSLHTEQPVMAVLQKGHATELPLHYRSSISESAFFVLGK